MTNARHDDSLLMDLDLLRNIEEQRIAEERAAEIKAREDREREARAAQRRVEAEEAARREAEAMRQHDLEAARLRAEAETRRLAIEAKARLEEKRMAIELAKIEAEAAHARMVLKPRRRWLPALVAAAFLALGAWFYSANQAQERRHQDLVAELQAIEAKAGELERRAAEMPDVEPVDYGDHGDDVADDSAAGAAADAPTSDTTTDDRQPKPRPRPEPRPEPEPGSGDDGRIVLDCDINSPLGCMDE